MGVIAPRAMMAAPRIAIGSMKGYGLCLFINCIDSVFVLPVIIHCLQVYILLNSKAQYLYNNKTHAAVSHSIQQYILVSIQDQNSWPHDGQTRLVLMRQLYIFLHSFEQNWPLPRLSSFGQTGWILPQCSQGICNIKCCEYYLYIVVWFFIGRPNNLK